MGDFLDEMIAERSRTNPLFPALLSAAIGQRRVTADAAVQRDAVGVGPEPK